MNILITGALQITPEQRLWLENRGHQVTFHPDERAVVEHPEQYEVAVCNGLFLYNSIESFVHLKKIRLTSAGLDRVPLEYIRAHGIDLQNASGVYSVPMAEFALSGILQLYKQSRFFAKNQAEHRWEKHRGLEELFGKRVCILGCGDVGRETAKRLTAFGCSVVGVNRTLRELPEFSGMLPLAALPEAAAECDIFICTIALTPETRGIVSRSVLHALPQRAVFVNLARGGLVEENALLQWLQAGGRAVLDVFPEEPLPESSPLWDMENVIITPHNSFVGEGNRQRLWEMVSYSLNTI